MVELADAPDSKSGDGDIVRVQVPPSAPPESLMKFEPLESEINSWLVACASFALVLTYFGGGNDFSDDLLEKGEIT